jgi:hypothetical protein
MGEKKKAKMGHRKGSTKAEPTAKTPTMLDHGHRVNDTTSLWTACGARRIGWTFGTDDEVTCVTCRGES